MFRNFLSKSSNFLATIDTFTINVTKRHAGHSKWSNIRHIKGAKDAQRSALFTRLARMMKVAILEGGSADPKMNLKLEQVIEQTQRANMPSATVQSLIKSVQGNKSQGKSYQLEIKGPGSCMILVDVFTDNLHQLKQTINTVMKKYRCKYADGGARHLFEEKGIIVATRPELTDEQLLEKATDDAIECGAEDVTLFDECVEFHCSASSLRNVATAIEKLYKVTSVSVEYIPLQAQELSELEMIDCGKVLERLEAIPEVVRTADNVA